MPQLIPPKAPAIPNAPEPYAAQGMELAFNALRLYFRQTDVAFRQLLLGFNNYGTFYDTTTQVPAAINTAYPVTLNTTGDAFGVTRDSTHTSRLTVSKGGLYRVTYMGQTSNSGGGSINIFAWLRKNGTDIAATGNNVVCNGPNDQMVLTWSHLVPMNAGDYVEMYWAADSTSAALHYVGATGFMPSVPSMVVSVEYSYPDSKGG